LGRGRTAGGGAPPGRRLRVGQRDWGRAAPSAGRPACPRGARRARRGVGLVREEGPTAGGVAECGSDRRELSPPQRTVVASHTAGGEVGWHGRPGRQPDAAALSGCPDVVPLPRPSVPGTGRQSHGRDTRALGGPLARGSVDRDVPPSRRGAVEQDLLSSGRPVLVRRTVPPVQRTRRARETGEYQPRMRRKSPRIWAWDERERPSPVLVRHVRGTVGSRFIKVSEIADATINLTSGDEEKNLGQKMFCGARKGATGTTAFFGGGVGRSIPRRPPPADERHCPPVGAHSQLPVVAARERN
ncbi:hypothetical protein THAOC_06331, partial [Thalassiosira oceanica]